MAKPKAAEVDDSNWLGDLIAGNKAKREAESQLPLVAERWSVVEKWPDYKEYNEYNYGPDYITGKTEVHGPWDTEEEAQKFIDTHDPSDKDGTFRLKHEYLRTHTKVWNQWGSV